MVSLAEMERTRKAAARILEEIDRAESRAERKTACYDGMPRDRNTRSKVETGAVIAADLQTVHAELTAQLEEMKTEFEEMCCSIGETDRRAVMRLRYLRGYKPEQIAEGCMMSIRSVYRFMKLGTEELLQRFPDRFQA